MTKNQIQLIKSFILRNVSPPEKGFVSRFWPKEMKLGKELFLKFPSEDFWAKILFEKKVGSLSWFKTKDGEFIFKKKYSEFFYKPPSTTESAFEISDGKFGETTHNNKEKKFMKDFLD